MPIPKLYLYKAKDVPVIGILRRGTSRDEWELVKWNIMTDEFIEGQWLRHKQMNGKHCAISPNGEYFYYSYNVFRPQYSGCGVISRIPNFTALYFSDDYEGSWTSTHFDDDNNIRCNVELQMRTDNDLIILPYTNGNIFDDGYISTETWMDPKGRIIRTEDGKLIADDIVIYDTTNHVFQNKTPIIL